MRVLLLSVLLLVLLSVAVEASMPAHMLRQRSPGSMAARARSFGARSLFQQQRSVGVVPPHQRVWGRASPSFLERASVSSRAPGALMSAHLQRRQQLLHRPGVTHFTPALPALSLMEVRAKASVHAQVPNLAHRSMADYDNNGAAPLRHASSAVFTPAPDAYPEAAPDAGIPVGNDFRRASLGRSFSPATSSMIQLQASMVANARRVHHISRVMHPEPVLPDLPQPPFTVPL